MRLRSTYPVSFIAAVTLILIGTTAAVPVATTLPIEVTTVAGSAAVRISGTATSAAPMQAVAFATFSPDLPIVFLRRKPLATDAAGHFETTIPIAPAYFDGTTIAVIVQTTAGVIVGRGSITLSDPTHSP